MFVLFVLLYVLYCNTNNGMSHLPTSQSEPRIPAPESRDPVTFRSCNSVPLDISFCSPNFSFSCLHSHIMAIHPELRSQNTQGSLSPQQSRAISTWTEQATASLQGLTVSEPRDEPVADSTRPGLRGASVSLAIPLDDDVPARTTSRVKAPGQSVTFRRREPLRRDSMRKREAYLKGKDGSRRRQRWENGAPHSSPIIHHPDN